MARTRYRSQPTLQRSRGRGIPAWVVRAGLAIVLTVAAVAAIRAYVPPPGPPSPSFDPAALVPAEAPAPALPPAIPPVPLAAPDSSAPSSAALPPAPPPASPSPPKVVPPVTARAPANPAPRPAPKAQAAQADPEQWEARRREYARDLAAYDERERDAGYRWARQNRVAEPGYCRAAGERTRAFMQGCLDYLEAASG